MSQNRRSFLKKMGLGTLAVSVLPLAWNCTGSESENKTSNTSPGEVGLQLFTLRDILPNNVFETLTHVSTMGYTHIETYGIQNDGKTGEFLGYSLAEFQGFLEKAQIKTYSGHYDLATYLHPDKADKTSLEFALRTAKALGQSYVIAPVPPIELVNELGAKEYEWMAQQLNEAGKMAQDQGIHIGYHNHFWEFRTLSDGRKGLDILIEQTDENLVVFEMDLFWTERAGLSNIDYFKKYPGRFPLWHLKDMDPAFNQPMLGPDLDILPLDSLNQRIRYKEVGAGSIDFNAIWQERTLAGAKHFYVEQDHIEKDKLTSIEQSLRYVEKELLSKG